MTSHKEEPNTSSLFGDSPGDDPFSQLQQQHSVSETVAKKDDKQPAVTQEQQPKAVAGDASSLFGNGSGSADLFFSSTSATHNATPQSTNPPEAYNASAASFFDGLGQNPASNLTQSYSQEQPSTNPASSLTTQAYDLNDAYANYDYNQQQPQQLQVEGEEQQYNESQWIQFDPNQHYYYDEQGQIHYYDPNTNQEYDISQYGSDQQGQPSDYQYDPQYADYYAQQVYDPNAYSTAVENTDVADNYDPNAYAPSAAVLPPAAATMHGQTYCNTSDYSAPQPQEVQHQQSYQPQSYTSVTDVVAEVPAQVQSEQTIDTQRYTTDQQQDQYGMQNYAPVDAFTDQQQGSTHHQSFDPNIFKTTAAADENTTTNFEQPQYVQDTAYAPVDFNNNYSHIQTDFDAEDLQQYQAPPPSRDVGPPPPGPPKKVLSPPSASVQAMGPQSIPPPPRSTLVSPPPQNNYSGSFDVNDAPEQSEQQTQNQEASEEDLNDLDDLVLGGSNSQQQEQISGNIDVVSAATDDYDFQKTTHTVEHCTEQSGDVNDDCAVVTSVTEDQMVPENHIKAEPVVVATDLCSYVLSQGQEKETTNALLEPQARHDTEGSRQISQSNVSDQKEPDVANEPDQSASYDLGYGHEPTSENTYESDQVISFEPYPISNYEPQETSPYEIQPVTTNEPVQTTYEPQQQQTSSYETQQDSIYKPQETASYQSQQDSTYEPEQTTHQYTADYKSESDNAYNTSSTTIATGHYGPQQYDPVAPFNYNMPPAVAPTTTSRTGSIRSVASPPPPPPMQHNHTHGASSTTEPDRRHHNGSPFAGHYGNPMMERSATVPPPMTERMASPRPQLAPCPDRLCEGENKPKAKFCCECGRPLAGISRSTTPSAISPRAYNNNNNNTMEGFSPMSLAAFGATAEAPIPRTALDDKKDAMIASLKQFVDHSVVIHSDLDDHEKRKRAVVYIDNRLASFDRNDESKALLWRVVKLMLEHQDNVLGDGGELDKSIAALVSSPSENATEDHLDQLEAFLTKGDRQGACQFAKDHDMWAHALIIATSVKEENSDLFRKIVAQFIQRELFSSDTALIPQVPGDRKALRMLYSVFNGVGADAVSEYVKSSFDAEAIYTEETLQGWQSALSLILANRSTNDQTAIQGLGDQLNRLNKNQEARLCYLLSPDVSGRDNTKMIGDAIYTDLDALCLLELYEFASKASIQQDFKLVLAWWLTELGFAEESKKYVDSVTHNIDASALDSLKQIGHVGTTESNSVTSLLNRETFDALIGSIESKVNSQKSHSSSSYAISNNGNSGRDYNINQTHDYTRQEIANDPIQQDGYKYGYSYGYGYGGGNTESADNTVPAAPFEKPKGMQSPFPAKVSSPFGHTVSDANDDNSPGTWRGGPDTTQTENQQNRQHETNASTNYQPDVYTPAATTTESAENTKMASWDDDDLGFGNSKPKKKVNQDDTIKTTDSTVQEKPNQVDGKNDKKPTVKAWSIFSIFSRTEKEHNTDEKKVVKANLGEEIRFYYDEKEKRWVNTGNDTKPAAAAAAAPQPPPGRSTAPPSAGLKLNTMPPLPSSPRPPPPISSSSSSSISSINPTPMPVSGGAPPTFNATPAGKRVAGGARKPMRSRYVDVFNADQK